MISSLQDGPVAYKVDESVLTELGNDMELSVNVPSPLSGEAGFEAGSFINVDDIPFLVFFVLLGVFSVDSSHFRVGLGLDVSEPFLVGSERFVSEEMSTWAITNELVPSRISVLNSDMG